MTHIGYDLVSLGEVMLRLSPPKFQRLRQMRNLDVCVAGSQLNVAANLAQLGKRTAFLTKLPDNELGYLVRDECQGYGVDMSCVPFIDNSRLGINYVEFAQTPRVSVAVYDRQHSAASTITPSDFDWPAILQNTRFAYTDGIFPGLSDNCRLAAAAFLETAKSQGCTTCFDMNYREHLWTPEQARSVWSTLLPYIDIVVTNRSVEEQVFGYLGSDEDLVKQHHSEFRNQLVCLTGRHMSGVSAGEWGSMGYYEGDILRGKSFSFEVVDRFGTGDAFFAGLIYGYQTNDVEYALSFGNAYCALSHTLEGDVARISPSEIEHLIRDETDLRLRR